MISTKTQNLIRYDLIRSFDFSAFVSKIPNSWHEFEKFLTAEAFQSLYKTFPDVSLFEKQVGRYRGTQKPHDRYLLSYEDSIYHQAGYEGKGIIRHHQLAEPWQKLIEELERSNGYKTFVESILRTSKFKFRYEWHLGFKRTSISPHVDIQWKLGSHLFYFNTPEDWDPKWGGSTLILAGKKTGQKQPAEFRDFLQSIPVSNIGERSLLMKNTPDAWHGVKSLRQPEGKFRKIFMVFFVSEDFSAERWLSDSFRVILKHTKSLKPKKLRSRAKVSR